MTAILIVDAAAYLGDVSQEQWQALHDGTEVYGAILKATQGTTYGGGEWFRTQWARVHNVDGYGRTWYRGAYHYLSLAEDGAKQAEFCYAVIRRAGGFDRGGDMRLFLDIERASNPDLLTADHVIATTYAFTRRWRQLAGHRPVLYARGLTRDLGIRSMMGCEGEWNASYTRTMATTGLVGGRDNVVLWQYAGRNSAGGVEGDASVHGLPLTIEGFPPNHDVSVYVDGANVPTLDGFRRRLLARLLDPALVALFCGVILAAHYGGGGVAA